MVVLEKPFSDVYLLRVLKYCLRAKIYCMSVCLVFRSNVMMAIKSPI